MLIIYKFSQLLRHLIYACFVCLVVLQYFSIRKHADKPNEGREDESMEANDMNFYEDIAFDFIPKDEDEDSIAMLIGNLNDHYPNPNNLMDLPIDLHQHHQATSSLPPVDYMTNPQYSGSSNDHMSFNDFVWWCDWSWYSYIQVV